MSSRAMKEIKHRNQKAGMKPQSFKGPPNALVFDKGSKTGEKDQDPNMKRTRAD